MHCHALLQEAVKAEAAGRLSGACAVLCRQVQAPVELGRRVIGLRRQQRGLAAAACSLEVLPLVQILQRTVILSVVFY